MTVQADHPTWTRSCGDCERHLFGANGELSTTEERQPDGSVVELPIARPPGVPPPCGVCPKLDGIADKKPLAEADDFGGLFADLNDWYAGGRAVGFAGPVDPLMSAVARLFLEHQERRTADRLGAAVRAEVGELLVSANVLRRV